MMELVLKGRAVLLTPWLKRLLPLHLNSARNLILRQQPAFKMLQIIDEMGVKGLPKLSWILIHLWKYPKLWQMTVAHIQMLTSSQKWQSLKGSKQIMMISSLKIQIKMQRQEDMILKIKKTGLLRQMEKVLVFDCPIILKNLIKIKLNKKQNNTET